MHIHFISPAAEENAKIPSLSLMILAALTPSYIKTTYQDDLINPINLKEIKKDVDMVAITVSTKTACRAYRIAEAYREKGVKVVMGGIHPTALPYEALEYADSVVIGEAEKIWPKLIKDFENGRLSPMYRQNEFIDCSLIPFAKRTLCYNYHYPPIAPIQITRGCPHLCEFCSVRTFFGGKYRKRPIDAVIDEIASISRPVIMIHDDNIIGDEGYAKELLSKMIPLKKRWVGQASLKGLNKKGIVKLLKKSGCIGLLIGFESISEKNIKQSKKFQNNPAKYMEVIDMLHKAGIMIWASFIYGLDYDDETIFEKTVEFAIKARFLSAVFAILTPYPKTPIYERLKKEGRLIDEKWWLKEDQEKRAPHFIPKNISREKLREGWQWSWKKFYSVSSIIRRFHYNYPHQIFPNLIHFPFNFQRKRFAKKKIIKGELIFKK